MLQDFLRETREKMKDLQPATCPVALLAGGSSAERPISLASGDGAQAALEEAGFPVTRFDPSVPEDMEALKAGAADGTYKVAFLCLHGKGGEDGTIQAELEAMGLPYTGSGVDASRIAINKNGTKEVYKYAELRTAPWTSFDAKQIQTAKEMGVLEVLFKKAQFVLGEKTVVKAVQQGSSQGLAIAETPADLPKYVDELLQYDGEVIIEKFIPGTEFTVAVLGNDNPEALPVIEIVPAAGFYDFDSKYAPGGSKHLCPAPISDVLAAGLQAYAVEAHKTIGCRGMSRTDFIVDQDEVPWLLETNTIPGMTKTSLLPDAARVAGISFPELCTMLIQFALE